MMKYQYYHLSENNVNGRTFKPRIPPEAEIDGDTRTKRVCFSTSITGCLKAVYPVFFHTPAYFYFHVNIPVDYQGDIVTPTEDQVYDVKETRERWFTSKVKLRCVGVIKARWTSKGFKFKWVERY